MVTILMIQGKIRQHTHSKRDASMKEANVDQEITNFTKFYS